jgi:hypothetical protein
MKINLFLAATLMCAGTANAEYFTDQGFNDPRVSGDHADATYGLWNNPLIFGPCLYPQADSCSSNPPNAFSNTNQFKNYPGNFTQTPWNLHYNNENWASQTQGVPGQSLMPSTELATNTFGFATIQNSEVGEQKYRAHLSINQLVPNPHPDGVDAIPHISIGEFKSRTNNPIGYLNDTSKARKVSFNLRVWNSMGDQNSLYFTQFYAFSEWGGKPRAVFINLYERNFSLSYSPNSNGGPGVNYKWNWPIYGSMLYPGADIAFFDANPAFGQNTNHCPGVIEGASIEDTASNHHFVIDIQRAFECASDWGYYDTPMPRDTAFPINIAGWSAEGSRDRSLLWVSVDSMKMHKLSDIIPIGGVFRAGADGSFVTTQKNVLNQLCGFGCTKLLPEQPTRYESTTTLLAASAINFGQSVDVSVKVLPANVAANKRVQITEGSAECFALLNNLGEGNCLLTPTIAGRREITATFAGNITTYFGSVASQLLSVIPTPPDLALSIVPIPKGCELTLSNNGSPAEEVVMNFVNEPNAYFNVQPPRGWICSESGSKVTCVPKAIIGATRNGLKFQMYQSFPSRGGMTATASAKGEVNLANNSARCSQ